MIDLNRLLYNLICGVNKINALQHHFMNGWLILAELFYVSQTSQDKYMNLALESKKDLKIVDWNELVHFK